MLRRNPEHVKEFFLCELSTDGNLDAAERLTFRGKFLPKTIETLLRKYIGEVSEIKCAIKPFLFILLLYFLRRQWSMSRVRCVVIQQKI